MRFLQLFLLLLMCGCASEKQRRAATTSEIKVDCEFPLADGQADRFSDYDRKLFKAIDVEFADRMQRNGDLISREKHPPFALVKFQQQTQNGLIDDIQILNPHNSFFENQCRSSISNFGVPVGSVPVSGIRKDHRVVTLRFSAK